MGRWAGHRPVTREALLAIFDRVVAGDRALSQSERALVIACEFWAAAGNEELVARFKEQPALSFLEVSEAFRSVGARYAADDLQRTAGAWSRTRSSDEREGHLEGLARRLAVSDDDVESRIAAYARNVLQTMRADVIRRTSADS